LLSSDTQASKKNSQDEPSKIADKQRNYMLKLPVINDSNIFSTLFFGWIYPFLFYGSKTTVTVDSMPKLPSNMNSES